MKNKFENITHIEGYVYEHDLKLKTSGPNSKNPGTQFISGDLKVATDEDCLNVITVHFTYVTPTTASGKTNATFTVLNNIIEKSYKTVMEVGKESAVKVRIDSALDLNEFYDKDDNLVSAKRNEGGFVHVTTDLNEEKTRNTFKTDMVITNVRRIEADEERNLPEKVIVKGAVFNFRKALLPVEFSATSEGAMNYFESLEASTSNPVFTKVWGRQVSTTVVTTHIEESAFGEPEVREVKSSRKDWVITGAATETYVWGEEDTITNEDLKKCMADRELHLAEIKKRRDEWRASQGNAIPAATVASTPEGEFKF